MIRSPPGYRSASRACLVSATRESGLRMAIGARRIHVLFRTHHIFRHSRLGNVLLHGLRMNRGI